ncbi:MAG: glycoside hydrolase family 5 protein [Treponema sp.]|nr:glycoside hydrolase family 5 protein [Treponema sp.]
MKKILLSVLMAVAVTFCCCAQSTTFDKSKAVKDVKTKSFGTKDSTALIKDMKMGWNLGNTMDATNGTSLNSEVSWGMPKTTKAMIDGLAKSGIKTIRIPVSWSNHLIDDKYTVDPAWMARVKEIVDWAIEDGMYVILNSHHDCYNRNSKMPYGKGYYPTSQNYEESKKFLVNVWSQISLAFNSGYDEHLIFETMNEPRLQGTAHEWWTDQNCKECLDAEETLNKMNQDVVNTIRKSGGNNAKRYIMVPGLRAAPECATSAGFKLPQDTAKNKLIVSVHMYTPYNFAMETPGIKDFTPRVKNDLAVSLKGINDKLVAKGIPVIIGEYGATNKGNLEARVEWFNFYISKCRQYNICAILWDNGQSAADPKNGEKFGYYNRKTQTWYFPEIIKAIVDNSK